MPQTGIIMKSRPTPPKLAQKALSWFLKDELFEEVNGDLTEQFSLDLQRKSAFRARCSYWFQVYHYLRPFAIRRLRSRIINLGMLKFNFLLTFRNIKRQKAFTTINITGLGLGLASCIFIALYVLDELSFDKHWTDGDRIYRAFINMDHAGANYKYGFATAPMADIFQNDFPEVELAARWSYSSPLTFRVNGKLIRENRVIYADQGIIPMFSLKEIYGEAQHALDEPNTMVLTKAGAEKYFGEANPVGKTIKTNDGQSFRITCVIEDIPKNSHFSPLMLRTTINDQWSDPSKVTRLAYWTISAYRTYLKLRPGTNPLELEQKFHDVYEQYFDPAIRDWSGQSWKEFIAAGNQYYYSLQPLKDIHLHTHFSADDSNASKGNIMYIYMFGAIGLFILIIACINFINLTTAKSSERAKEIGLKKVMGSSRHQILKQFLLESLIISLLSLTLAMLLTYILLPEFNLLANKEFEEPFFNEHQIWLYALLGTIGIGLLSGYYPAFLLSGNSIHSSLKNNPTKRSGISLRNLLVIVQFSISSSLILGTIVVYDQLQFTQSKKLGFIKDNILVINNAQDLGNQLMSFKEELKTNPQITNVSAASHIPSDLFFPGTFFSEAVASKQEVKINGSRMWVDPTTLSTLGIKLLSGRNFHVNSQADSLSVLLNESAVKALDFDEPLGRKIQTSDGKNQVFTVVGIVEDFHLRSLRHAIVPTALHLSNSPKRLVIRFLPGDLVNFFQGLETLWKNFSPDHIMTYELLSDRYERLYTSEKRMGTIFNIFVVLAILIASLGLLGLSSVITVQRKKEIGIRKVLGASVRELVILLNSGLTTPVLIALLIGLPTGFVFMDQWLQDFAYRIRISWTTIIASGFTCLLVAWLVVSYLTIQSAQANPTDNLRYE